MRGGCTPPTGTDKACFQKVRSFSAGHRKSFQSTGQRNNTHTYSDCRVLPCCVRQLVRSEVFFLSKYVFSTHRSSLLESYNVWKMTYLLMKDTVETKTIDFFYSCFSFGIEFVLFEPRHKKAVVLILMMSLTCVSENGCHSNLDTSAHLMNTY